MGNKDNDYKANEKSINKLYTVHCTLAHKKGGGISEPCTCRDTSRPRALAAALLTDGPSCLGSPHKTTCVFGPASDRGTSSSGSVACELSSMNT